MCVCVCIHVCVCVCVHFFFCVCRHYAHNSLMIIVPIMQKKKFDKYYYDFRVTIGTGNNEWAIRGNIVL